MNDMMTGIGFLLLVGSGAIAIAVWLSRRQSAVARAAGALVAAGIALFCATVVFALTADNWESGLSSLRTGGALSLLAFVLVGLGAVLGVCLARRSRGEVSS